MSDSVSPAQGNEPLAKSGVKATSDLCIPGYRPLFSQYKGQLLYNDATKEPEPKPEPEPAPEPQKDPEKQNNFDKVREKAEREEAARKKAEEELAQLRAEREEEERKKREEKEEFQKLYEEEKAKREALEKENGTYKESLEKIEQEQEAELQKLLEAIPEDKRPPLDSTDPVAKRLSQVRYAQSLLNSGPKPPVGAGVKNEPDPSNDDRLKELRKLEKERPLTQDEIWEMTELQEAKTSE